MENYHRDNSNTDKCLFLRIDQHENHLRDLISKSQDFKNLIPYLSGAVFSRPDFPEIILEETALNKQDEIFSNLLLFSTDYFGRQYFLNRSGEVVFYYNNQFVNISVSLDEWIYNEINKF